MDFWMSTATAADNAAARWSYNARENSCVAAETRLRVLDYRDRLGYRTAGEILRQAYGQHPYRLVLDQPGGQLAVPVRAAVETCAQGYRLTLQGGRAVTLTGGHAVPIGGAGAWPSAIRQVALPSAVWRTARAHVVQPEYVALYERDPRYMYAGRLDGLPIESRDRVEGLAWAKAGSTRLGNGGAHLDIGQSLEDWREGSLDWAAERYRPIQTGDQLLDGIVEDVQPVGRITSIRLWLDRGGWMQTEAGLRVGHRAHELAYAWVAGETRVWESYSSREEYDEYTSAPYVLGGAGALAPAQERWDAPTLNGCWRPAYDLAAPGCPWGDVRHEDWREDGPPEEWVHLRIAETRCTTIEKVTHQMREVA